MMFIRQENGHTYYRGYRLDESENTDLRIKGARIAVCNNEEKFTLLTLGKEFSPPKSLDREIRIILQKLAIDEASDPSISYTSTRYSGDFVEGLTVAYKLMQHYAHK